MESCGMSLIKYILITFNSIFAILGVLIVVAASYENSLIGKCSNIREVSGIETNILLIVIGQMIFIISAFGCFGALKENTKLLYLYTVCLILIIILELSVSIAAAVLKPQVEIMVKKHLRESFIKNKADSKPNIFWDNLQKNLECCGVIGPEDYTNDIYIVPIPPLSCCPMMTYSEEDRRSVCVIEEKYFKKGCEDKILELVHGAGLAIIITGIVLCFLEIISVILVLWLASSIKNKRKAYPKGVAIDKIFY